VKSTVGIAEGTFLIFDTTLQNQKKKKKKKNL
jgi:hypothetical protein